MCVVPLRRPAGGEVGRDESLGSMKQKYEGKDLHGLVDLAHSRRAPTQHGAEINLAKRPVSVKSTDSQYPYKLRKARAHATISLIV
jgi:hypothetical protein